MLEVGHDSSLCAWPPVDPTKAPSGAGSPGRWQLAVFTVAAEIYLLGNILGSFPHICHLLFWVTNPAIIFGIDWLRLDWFLCNPNQLPMAGFSP
jgi:hypothetical protein